VHEAGGRVFGVIPEALQPREVSGTMLGETVIVHTMHERKALMAEKASFFIALPGGFGCASLQTTTTTTTSPHLRSTCGAELTYGVVVVVCRSHGGDVLGSCECSTFEELFEIITWVQLGIINKPVGTAPPRD